GYFNLNVKSVNDAAAQFDQPAYRLLRADYDSEQIADFLPHTNTPVNGRFTVAGRLKAPEAKVVLQFGNTNDANYSETLVLKRSDVNPDAGALSSRLWAQMKV